MKVFVVKFRIRVLPCVCGECPAHMRHRHAKAFTGLRICPGNVFGHLPVGHADLLQRFAACLSSPCGIQHEAIRMILQKPLQIVNTGEKTSGSKIVLRL